MSELPNSMKLKFGWPFPEMKHGLTSRFISKSSLVVPIFGSISKIWICWLNSTQIHNASTFSSLIEDRPSDQSLITLSNHDCCLDDPLLYGILPWKCVSSFHHMRWSLAAHDVVFTTRLGAWFFSLCKVVPVIRGMGVNQRGVDFCTDRLREGSWVHIFPEGKVNTAKEHLRLKWGIGRLIYDCWKGDYEPNSSHIVNSSSLSDAVNKLSSDEYNSHLHQNNLTSNYSESSRVNLPGRLPIVLPIYHCGLDSILPNKKPYIPLVGKKVTVLVGEPIYLERLLAKIEHLKLDRVKARKIITDHIQEEFYKLKKKAKEIHSKRL